MNLSIAFLNLRSSTEIVFLQKDFFLHKLLRNIAFLVHWESLFMDQNVENN